jgi:hypothetical protein
MRIRLVSAVVVLSLLALSLASRGGTTEPSPVPDALHAWAAAKGSVRVIVRLNTPFAPEGLLASPAHVRSQRQMLAGAQSVVRNQLRGVRHRVVRDFRGTLPLMAIEASPDALRMLASLRGVVADVQVDELSRPALVDSVPLINADDVWSLGSDGTGQIVAILDTGVQKDHEFFTGGKVIAEACFSSNTDFSASVCPGGVEFSGAPGSGLPCPPGVEGCEHGTHVAGIAAGSGPGFSGVAKGAQIIAIQVFSQFPSEANCGVDHAPCALSWSSDQIDALNYVNLQRQIFTGGRRIAAANMSLGGNRLTATCPSDPRALAINQLRVPHPSDPTDPGVATIVAAGNFGFTNAVSAPACVPSAIPVASSDKSDVISFFSNMASPSVFPNLLIAPGESIQSSIPPGPATYAFFSGTSMAAPHVAGAFAVLRTFESAASVDQIAAALKTSGVPITDTRTGGSATGRRIDLLAATSQLQTVFDFSQSAYSVTEGGTATITVLRSGNRSGTATVQYAASAGTALPADFQPAAGTLTFGNNVASAAFTVKTTANTVVDGNRSVNVVLSNPTGLGAMLGATSSATLNIVDEDTAGTVKLGAATYSVLESGKNVGIVIQRSGGAASGVVVQFQTSDGTAHAGTNYTGVNSSVMFNAGETTKTVQVPITDTPVVDGSRNFTFALTGATPPSTVIGSPSSAVVTIGDLDVAGSLQFSAATYTTSEPPVGPGSVTITVTRTGGMAGGVTVNFATVDGSAKAGSDYTATSGTLTFGLGNTSATFSIPILTDSLVEGDETVLLTLSSPGGGGTLGAQKTAVLTIKDSLPGVQFSAAGYSVAENAASATITVVRTGPAADVATVRYSTSDGTAKAGISYKATSGALSFASGVTKATFTVPIIADKQVTNPLSVLLLLSSPSLSTALGPLSSAVLTIGNVDVGGSVKLASPTFSITEAAGSAVITVSRTGGTAGGVTVDYEATDQPCGAPPCPGKAQGGFDYQAVSGTLTFGVGETTKTVLIPVTNDSQVNANRTFLVNLSNVQGGATLATPSSALVTIMDDDQGGVLQFSAPTYTVSEPATGTADATIKVTRTGSNLAGASVQFATSNGTATAGSDYTATATTLVFGAGETFKNVAVPILSGATAEGNETVNLTLSNPGGGATLGTPATAVLTIVDSESSARFSSATYSVTEGAAATITVVRGGPTTGTLKVDYTTSNGTATAGVDYSAKLGTLTFGPGVSTQTFSVSTLNNSDTVDGRTVTLALTPNGAGSVASPSSATLTINDNDAPGTFQFSAAMYSVTEGGAAPQVTVTRSGGTGGTVPINWTATGGSATGGALPTTPGADYAPTSGVLTFGPGIASLKLPLTIVNDTLAENAETIDLALTLPLSAPPGAAVSGQTTATLTILDNDSGGTIQFAVAAQTVAENVAGGKANLVINRTGTNLAGGITVSYAATGGDVSAITLPMGTLTFAAGQTSLTLPVPIGSNAAAEPDRSVTITLSNPQSAGGAGGGNAPVLGMTASTALKIVDDEPRLQFGAASFAVTEGGIATITVTRTGSMTGQATVNYATSNGTGLAGTNYTAASGTLTFPAATVSRTFTVATLDDLVAAGSSTVNLTLSGAVGASIGGTNPATLTIQDKQSAGAIQFAASTATVVEGAPGDPGSTVRITVTRTGSNLIGPIIVGWSATGGSATSPADFSPSFGTLTFGPGVTSQVFEISAVDDGVTEGIETIALSLDPPSGGAVLGSLSQMTVYIIDGQQSVAFTSANFTVGETTAQAVVSVVRLGVPNGTVTVTASTVPGTAQPTLDYGNVSTVLTFAAGEIIKSFNVPIATVNAPTRNLNRALGLQLSNTSVNAALIGASTATLTILDFRPDLVVASVGTPASTLTGKTLSAPTTVKNLGQVASPAFRVGIFMAKDTGSPDDGLPGVGSLVLQRDVPALAAGAGIALPTQLAIADDLPAGNYFVSAVANFNQSVIEADPNNNGLSSSPSVLKVSSNFSKLQSASASFNLGDAGGGGTSVPAGGPSAPMVTSCSVNGSVNLTGSFSILTQQLDTATGFADLTGTVVGGPFDSQVVRFVIGFTGTGDDSNNITASLTSIAVSGAFTATGLGSPSGTFTGTLTGGTLSGTATGTITGSAGDCAFSGPLTAVAQTSFVFRFGTRVSMGTFGFGTTPDNVPTLVSAPGYAATLHVLFDNNLSDPSTVRFTGPTGSGFSSTPADPGESHIDDDGTGGSFVSPPGSGVAPGGTWSVFYKGATRAFNVPQFDANRSLVVVFPTVTVDTASGTLTQVNWEYQDRSGNRLSGPPSFMRGLRLMVWMNRGGSNQPESPDLGPTVTSFNFSANGITPPEWSQVNAIVFQYEDLLGNEYTLLYQKIFSVQVETRLENVYDSSAPPTTGRRERIINAFVDVPFSSVDSSDCASQGAGPYFVTIQNRTGIPGAAPYESATCMERTSTTFFPDGIVPVDIFSTRDNLDNFRNTAQGFPALALGTPFEFNVTPMVGSPQTVVTTLRNAEANPTTDFITIPNPSTPTLKPGGFGITHAKLGQNLTVSWTLPTSFEIGNIMLTANVTAIPQGGGGQSSPAFTLPPLTCTPSSIELPLGTTSATLKFPSSCFGEPVTQAQFCIFITGTPATQDKRTTACWFFQ